ncbi:MAG: zinc metallopeptidase [Rhodobiaceae bacterium]|nr:zinc metallopeptidase [Rhodobiaceae bacterium]MCC0056295.1 zinc metallopeptidase [Rhodobiaceae bacterium]
MRWRGRRESQNVEDRRGEGGGFGRGGFGFPSGGGRVNIPMGGGTRKAGFGGIGAILVILLISWVLGINPLTLLGGGEMGIQPQQQQEEAKRPPADDEKASFVSVVLADTEDTWSKIFESKGAKYTEPTLVLFENRIQSACGFAQSASGPFYCPNDQKLYIDLGFYDELRRQFNAPGDFAQAYVIAHEVGHHVQNLMGVLQKFHEARQRMSSADANALSVRVELQADCLAGIWAHYTERRGLLEEGDVDEAMNAAKQIGDDAIQKRTQGYVVPESFNHGTSAQRMRWFRRGMTEGEISACDTFGASEP